MEWIAMPRWSPYLVGAGIGILSWIAFFISNKTIGTSTSFARTAGMIEKWFRGEAVEEKAYYQRYPPVIDWQWMLVLGIVIGAFLSAQLSDTFALVWVPTLWAEAFGSAPIPRLITALIGGILMGIGARWAGGCTSGHGISGTLQLAISGWLAAICFFIGGIATAMLIFRVLG